MKAKVGDWVRWMRAGELIIGEVAYVGKADRVLHNDQELHTDKGILYNEDILEIRRKKGSDEGAG